MRCVRLATSWWRHGDRWLCTRWIGSGGTWARLWPGQWECWSCRQLLVLGDAVAVGVMVGGLLV